VMLSKLTPAEIKRRPLLASSTFYAILLLVQPMMIVGENQGPFSSTCHSSRKPRMRQDCGCHGRRPQPRLCLSGALRGRVSCVSRSVVSRES
jgi:hypothetical protein